jgi:hypothetical protein
MNETTSGVLSFGKEIEDIEKPELMPADYYLFRVSGKPRVEDNAAQKALKEGKDPGKKAPGQNWVVPLRSISETPELDGRAFNVYLPLPSEADMKAFDMRGQRVYDAKMERIVGFVEKFGGTAKGRDVTLQVGCIGGIQVIQQLDARSGEITNALNIFSRAGVKSAEEMGVPEETLAELRAIGSEDEPF